MVDQYTLPYGKMIVDCSLFYDLTRAARDLEILKKSYAKTKYGTIDSAIAEAILGPKPAPPEPDPLEVAQNAIMSAVKSAEKAADYAAKLACSAMGEDDHA